MSNEKKDTIESVHNSYVYVDIQGFRKPKGLICKEFCLVDDNDFKFHAFVKPTVDFKKLSGFKKHQATYLMKHYHKIPYDFGTMDPFDLCDQMYPKLLNKIVLVEGSEKVRWLKYMFRKHGEIECIDINTLNFDTSLKKADPYDICDFHNSVFGWTPGSCAMGTGLLIQDLTRKNIDKF